MKILKLRACLAAAAYLLFAQGQAWAIAVGTYDLEILSTSTLGTVGTSLGTVTVAGLVPVLQVQLDSGFSFTGPVNEPGFAFNIDKIASTARR